MDPSQTTSTDPTIDLTAFEHGLSNDMVTANGNANSPNNVIATSPDASAYQAAFDPSNKNVYSVNTGYLGNASATLSSQSPLLSTPIVVQGSTNYMPLMWLGLAVVAYFFFSKRSS